MSILKHIKIEKAFNPQDIEQIDEVYFQSWLATYPNKELGILTDDIYEIFKDKNSPERLAKKINHLQNIPETDLFLIAKNNDHVIGVCLLRKLPEYNQLQSIYILPEFQGMGIGSMLWNSVLEFLDPNKKTIVHVATYNTQAINFYKKLGFLETDKRFLEERHRMPISGVCIPEMEMVLEKKLFRKGVSALILNSDNKILLVNLESFETKFFAVPGGGVDQGETLEDAVYREIKEELGIDTTSLVLQGVCEQSLQLLFKNGKKLKRNDIEYDGMERFFFGFRFIGNDDEIVAQVGEIRTYAWVSFDDLKDYLLFDNQLQDTTEKLLELFPSLQR